MAEMGELEPIPSSSSLCENEIGKDEEGEPSSKRRKISKCEKTPSDKLEHRLGGILCCAVCLDLPRAAVYQCTNGHLMCAGCFTHVLADARLRDETATCPNCRVEISKTSASRNLAVEKAISELPSECQYCAKEFPRHALDNHQGIQCDDRYYKLCQIVINSLPGYRTKPEMQSALMVLVRVASDICYMLANVLTRPHILGKYILGKKTKPRPSGCKYWLIGCPWQGPHHELAQHEGGCPAPAKSGAEVVEILEQREKQRQEKLALYNQMFELLSFEKITFSDLQLKPYRTEEFVNKLYYETSRFSAFNHQWVVKAYINNSQRDPTQSSEREITYQLILKSKSSVGLSVQYVALRGPHGDARVSPCVHAHCFGDDAPASPDAPPVALPLPDARETNRLLSNKAISFRLIMFLASK